MSETEETVSPTDSLNSLRPTQLIPPDSPVRFSDIYRAGTQSLPNDSDHDSAASSLENSANGISANGECTEADIPSCLTPTLQDSKLSQMLANVAHQDKNYVGGEMIDQSDAEGASKKTTTPVECLSPFWAKAFPAQTLYSDTEKDGPGGKKVATSSTKERKIYPMTLNLAEKRLFVINNDKVVEDGKSLGHSSGASTTTSKSCIRYFHEGAVMELIPGYKPTMRLINAINPKESIDGGSAMTEIPKQKVVSPIERCLVESGFCAFLVLRYDDPENPQLEAINSPDLKKKLKDLKDESRTPSDEHFTPIVNIAREASSVPEDQYTTAIFFTTDQYNYFVHVDKQDLTLKKFKIGDTSPSSNPRNNKQFRDKVDTNCSECVNCKNGVSKCGRAHGKDEVDSSMVTTQEKKMKVDREDSFDAGSPGADSADGSSNPRSSSSQLSSPEGSNILSPSKSKLLLSQKEKQATGSDPETLDSGVEAN